MSISLTPDNLAAAYEYLRTTQPFKRWALPDADEVKMHVVGSKAVRGHFHPDGTISISAGTVATSDTLIHTMAHEMIHLHQRLRKTETANTEHNAEFNRLARLVCRRHGYVYKEFL